MNSLTEALVRRLDVRAAQRMQRAEAIAADLSQRATLIGIERDGRMLTWVFERAGEVHRVETIGSISDNMPGWRRALLEPLSQDDKA